jgi:outer membrane protein OmpA-like peptidoglycan-associated protein/Tfp pilus assembly protein PilF
LFKKVILQSMRVKQGLSIILLICAFSFNLKAQKTYTTSSAKAIKLYEEGKLQYRSRNFIEAEKSFLKAIKYDTLFQEPYMVLAEMYWDQKDYTNAINTYHSGLVINPKFYPQGFLNKGELEIKTGDYKSALISFNQFLNLEKSSTKYITQAQEGVRQAEFALNALNNPVFFDPQKLDSTVNSADNEYWPSLSADANTLVFTRLVGSSKGLDIQEDFFISEADSGRWLMAKDAGAPLNTSDNEGAQSIAANGKFMIYTVCNRRGVIGKCDLYFSEKFGDTWSAPQNIGPPINTKYKETQPCLSSDGRTLYFVSDRPGGFGKLDIWMSKQNINGEWMPPVNLGDSINTSGFESSPFIHHDNSTLYFSSNQHLGMGGFDIFYSRRNKNDAWGKAVNMGYPINTFKDEIGLIVTAKGDLAFYSSDINSKTGKDIYSFKLYDAARPTEVSYLKGNVYEKGTRKALKASFELYDLSDGGLLAQSYSDYRNGEFLICIPTNRNYMLNVSKEGYLFYSENFSLEGVFHLEEPFSKDIPLTKIVAGKSIVLRNIFFETDDYVLKQESKYELDKVLSFLINNANLKVEISGHTDSIGSESYNQELSEKRAQSVVDYLVLHGIEKERLISKGYGMSNPIDSNDSFEGRANNRRTELMVLN